jgi:hypothetical protein
MQHRIADHKHSDESGMNADHLRQKAMEQEIEQSTESILLPNWQTNRVWSTRNNSITKSWIPGCCVHHGQLCYGMTKNITRMYFHYLTFSA